LAGADAMPFATTTSVAGPLSKLAGTSNSVVIGAKLPVGSTPIRL